jgi:hypothetical protein
MKLTMPLSGSELEYMKLHPECLADPENAKVAIETIAELDRDLADLRLSLNDQEELIRKHRGIK